jgi:hypothetical protein
MPMLMPELGSSVEVTFTGLDLEQLERSFVVQALKRRLEYLDTIDLAPVAAHHEDSPSIGPGWNCLPRFADSRQRCRY